MTYRERLEKEYPDRVNAGAIGGCLDCPYTYGYELRSSAPCKQSKEIAERPAEIRCTNCWNRVIPGTEDDKYKNLTRDELIGIIKHLENTIERLDKEREHLCSECQVRDKTIEDLDEKITKLEGACSAKNAEIVRLDKELNEEKTRKYFWCEDNCCAMVKDKEIAKLKDKIEFKKAVINVANDTIKNQDKEIAELKKSVQIRCELKDYWYNECKRLVEKVRVLENTLNSLNQDLEAEKKEHSKHHSIFRIFYD